MLQRKAKLKITLQILINFSKKGKLMFQKILVPEALAAFFPRCLGWSSRSMASLEFLAGIEGAVSWALCPAYGFRIHGLVQGLDRRLAYPRPALSTAPPPQTLGFRAFLIRDEAFGFKFSFFGLRLWKLRLFLAELRFFPKGLRRAGLEAPIRFGVYIFLYCILNIIIIYKNIYIYILCSIIYCVIRSKDAAITLFVNQAWSSELFLVLA